MESVTSFQYDAESGNLIIEGVRVSPQVALKLIFQILHPDPRRWYRFERVEDNIIVHLRQAEFPEETMGQPIAQLKDAEARWKPQD